MAARKKRGKSNEERTGSLGFENKLWEAADALRNNVDPSEYKHIVLGLIFLKYIEDAFEERRATLAAMVSDPQSSDYIADEAKREAELTDLLEDRDEYVAENVFWLPPAARWTFIRNNAKRDRIEIADGGRKRTVNIGGLLDFAMEAIEKEKGNERLKRTLLAYQNRSLEAAQVIQELINLAKEMRDAPKRGDRLGLTEDELSFYDALADHGDVRDVMGDETLATIAHELVDAIRRSVTIDWTRKEAVRADLRRKVKRLLRKHGYPPDKRPEAVETVIAQAEALCKDWAEAA